MPIEPIDKMLMLIFENRTLVTKASMELMLFRVMKYREGIITEDEALNELLTIIKKG